jgi:hypothetical protein
MLRDKADRIARLLQKGIKVINRLYSCRLNMHRLCL